MSARITLEHTNRLIRKLKATQAPKQRQPKHHLLYDVYENGVLLFSFSVSHTPKKGKPQSHIPVSLRLSAHKTKAMAECHISRDEYIKEVWS